MIDKIRNERQYNQLMTLIEKFIQKATDGGGFHSLNKEESNELERLSILAERYEDEVMKIMPLPVTLNSLVESKMEELNLTQKGLSEILGIGTSKLSQILNGKRNPDLSFLKAVHQKLGIDGNFILEHV
jgi:antitoxin component HigA of HigAB toxin-antitoxin module